MEQRDTELEPLPHYEEEVPVQLRAVASLLQDDLAQQPTSGSASLINSSSKQMYRCELCNAQTGAGQSKLVHRIQRTKLNRFGETVTEIEREVAVCTHCQSLLSIDHSLDSLVKPIPRHAPDYVLGETRVRPTLKESISSFKPIARREPKEEKKKPSTETVSIIAKRLDGTEAIVTLPANW